MQYGALVGAGLLLLLGASASAGRDHADALELRERGAIIPLEEILRTASAQRPGRVVDVELERDDGAYVYEIQLLDAGGEVWELKYDARTGALLGEGAEH